MSLIDVAKERRELYSQICKEFLESYLKSNYKIKEIEQSDEFREAIENYNIFHPGIQRKVIFGGYVVEGLKKIKKQNLNK